MYHVVNERPVGASRARARARVKLLHNTGPLRYTVDANVRRRMAREAWGRREAQGHGGAAGRLEVVA